ncbi:MAG: Holliday junction branch migration protein RuvA [Porticoccaceae bacterium]|jgi:Holliday junction DNA helicase RuvA|nr:Holliday junction branch migration protein RuvA [Porticoccaceae bacterium]MEA3299228.1 Holliday junction branch migration protein RuvA [Pseudomonadota bacterium]HLS98847.1 Holliday junction branch migration protein RuvA [Porticoccaceae bacterium]
MIGRIRGTLLEKQAPELLVDVQGVGYEVQVSLTTYFSLPALGEVVTLHTHFVVREDAQQLFGFATLAERGLFRALVRVSGVGPKMALAILSGMTPEEFARCVRGNDVNTLVRLPGVGRKTAERLVVEMKDRLDAWPGESAPASGARPSSAASDVLAEAESALIALGYKPQDATKMISAAAREAGEGAASETLIRQALKSAVTK